MKKNKILENIISLSVALLVVLMIRSSVIEAYKIPSGSMIPTLLVGDHIFVNKFAYGLKVPILEWFMDDPVYIFRRSPPKRGDVIVFKYPRDESTYYIKRVIGVPGDIIDWKEKVLYVNGKAQDKTALPLTQIQKMYESFANDSTGKYSLENLEIYEEKFEDKKHLMMTDDSNYFALHQGPWKVPEMMYFVMGDNRDHSNDSRFWGFVPDRNIKGKAMVIWLNLWLEFEGFGLNTDTSYLRLSRVGSIIR